MYNRKRITTVVAVILFLLFAKAGMYCRNFIKSNLSSVSARYQAASVPVKDILKLNENFENNPYFNLPDITLWNLNNYETVFNKMTNITSKTNVIEVFGDMSQVMPMKFIQGNYIYSFDPKGCVLDTQTAYNLFGTTDVMGNIVVWDEKEYIVRGVIRAKEEMMLIQISEEGHLYQNVEAVYGEGEDSDSPDDQGKLFEELLAQGGLPRPDAVIDGDVISKLLGLIYLLPIWIVIIHMGFYCVKRVYHIKKPIIYDMAFSIAVVLILILLIRITDFGIYIPAQFIPTKWSDFDFYIDKHKEISDTLNRINSVKLMPKDMLRNRYALTCVTATACSMIILIILRPRIRKKG